MDVLLAGGLLVITAPMLLVVAIAVRIRLGAPVLFRQRRPGQHGKPFVLFKLRTMLDLLDREGQPLPDEQRMTPFGALLRKTSVDELPQLVNVLRGDMSLVGPRPLLMQYLPLYSPQQARRHEVRPGITGWAQIHGRNSVSWPQRFALDVWYVDHQSFALDCYILWKTLGKVFAMRGVRGDVHGDVDGDGHKESHVTMPPFRGEQLEDEMDRSSQDRTPHRL